MSGLERVDERLAKAMADLGNLIVDDEGAADRDRIVREAKAVEERNQRADRLEAAGLELAPKAHASVVSGSGLAQTTSLTAVQRWIWRSDLMPILVLVGAPGCGKSVAAAWAVANFGGSVCWQSATEVVRVFSASFGDALKLQERVKKARLTVLDDIATEGDKTKMCSALIEILGHREQRKTLITTNQDLAAWKSRYTDPRLHSRLNNAYFVPDNGPDLRGKP